MGARTEAQTRSSQHEIDEFLAFYPPAIARKAHVLRALAARTIPDAVERLRPGWRLIGYDLPITRHGTYFAWVWPQPEHVHIGFEIGTLMSDPHWALGGAHLRLKRVRYLTFGPSERIPRRLVTGFIRDAARIASMSRAERQSLGDVARMRT